MVSGLEYRPGPQKHRQPWATLGIIDGGLELMRLGTTGLRHKWSIRREGDDKVDQIGMRTPDRIIRGHHRCPQRILEEAVATTDDPQLHFRRGMEDLDRHRRNHDDQGPTPPQLQLLWWEFPEEHWTALREGSHMNFLVTPPAELHDNSDMDEEQTKVAGAFVDELVGLGVLRDLQDEQILATAPLFCIPKEGQPGEWRVIADMLRGGQNGAIGSDPVVLPRPLHILDLMYEGGYSAVVDASKFFYQFRTHPSDRPFLGIRHPIMQALLAYFGLPMGSGSSPGLASRYGIAFLRRLRETYPHLFGGVLRPNCFWTGFTPGLAYDPSKGYGYYLAGPNGASARVWVFVDDFLIHAPTRDLCERALKAFLDATVECGMLCHPKKLVPPSQQVRYCGVIFDTTTVPTLRIPEAKRETTLTIDPLLSSEPNVADCLQRSLPCTECCAHYLIFKISHPPALFWGNDMTG